MIDRRRCLGLLAAAPLALRAARAQPIIFPSRPVYLVIPFAAAGGADVIGRLLAARLTDMWGQPVVVENRSGAGGNIAAEQVARAEPDGYTLLLASIGHAINRFMFAKLAYDPVDDFAPVSLICTYPNIMVVPNSSPAHTVQEFIDYARANPGRITFASSSNGTSVHLAGELFKRMAHIEMTHIPYRGAGPAYNDVIPGRIDVMFPTASSAVPLMEAGKLRALAVTSARRWDALPEIPAIAETVPGYQVDVWYGIAAPRGTPAQVVTALNKAVNDSLADQKLIARFAELGGQPMPMSSEEMSQFVARDVAKWAKVVQFANIKAE